MKRGRFFARTAVMAMAASVGLTSCDNDTISTILGVLDYLTDDDGTTICADDKGLGWLEDDEDTSTIEDDIQINTDDDSEVGADLPSSVDLTRYLPPIGDQGEFGTCVAWATAYNCRTWLNAQSKGLSQSELSQKKNQFSAGDMFKAIDSDDKGSECQGSNFQAAFNKMVSRGVATVATSPYMTSSSECDCSNTSSENSEAAKYKIKSYREIDISSVKTVKRYLYEGHPVVFGAKLGDNFMNASGSSVLYSNGTFNSTGMHAYHAIMIVGYDDNRGSNGAFRVVNSWGESWGDDGFIWVDCNFLCSSDFAYCGFVAYLDDDDTTSYGVASSTVDLQPSMVTDEDDEEETDGTWRKLSYDVLNAGTGTVGASSSWGNAYLLYNAYNANEYTIVLIDIYSDAFALEKGEMNGSWDETEAAEALGIKAEAYSLTNIDVPGGTTVASAYAGEDTYFEWTYKMPDVTGKYYLVMLADAFGSVEESDETNNYYFLTAADGGPLDVKNGVISSSIGNNKALRIVKRAQNAHFAEQTAVNATAPNTYSPAEISKMLNAARQSGELRNKALEWANSDMAKMAKPKVVKRINK